jgi:hypothetical protein
MIKMVTKLTVLILLFGVLTTNAQWKDNAGWFNMNLGYTPLTNPISENTMDGWNLNFTYERFLKGSHLALGGNLAFMNAGDDYLVNNDRHIVNFQTFMFTITGKYIFGSGNINYYIGLGLGWQKTTASGSITSGLNTYQDMTHFDGPTFSLPIGFNVFVSENTFVGLNLMPFYADNESYDSDINFMINATLGFQMP